ncbi:hypothetical protein BN10_270016 [Phycicoccus elongatus Lp2]|uniref:Aminotransferase n=1 Tax=Phycicoccus elongatus Lp2 TaxID=1193181 RepID=N0E1G3_9MICO|nr:hypothetical protein BN10_270016 [Phycicoccus elongatus Lp2]
MCHPHDADLVVLGNPTNPTGVLHPAGSIRQLLRPGRVVVVDEAFMDSVPGEPESLVSDRAAGLVVVRSLTKLWSMPGIRAGFVVGDAAVVADLAAHQPPWSVSTPAMAATVACSTAEAADEAHRRVTCAHVVAGRPRDRPVLPGDRTRDVLGPLRPGPPRPRRAGSTAGERYRRPSVRHLPRTRRLVGPHRRAPACGVGPARRRPRGARRLPSRPAEGRRFVPSVTSPSPIARQHATKRLGALATPPGALGRLGDLGVWLAACQGRVPTVPVDDARM